jgi:hypothetical protein
MSIVSSSVAKAIDIGGGEVFVIEHHTDSDDVVHELRYVLGDSTDPATKLAAHAASLETDLAEAEAEEILG